MTRLTSDEGHHQRIHLTHLDVMEMGLEILLIVLGSPQFLLKLD